MTKSAKDKNSGKSSSDNKGTPAASKPDAMRAEILKAAKDSEHQKLFDCDWFEEAVNLYNQAVCQNKANTLRPCPVDGEAAPHSNIDCSCLETKECKVFEPPVIKPCISISWGDSQCDCAETDDVEILCITVCNCYSNVTFKDLTINAIFVLDGEGNLAPELPDGSPSVQIVPIGPICFGDIPPCREGEAGCVSRQVTLWTRGAKPGTYQIITSGVCFEVCFDMATAQCFTLELCAN